jgi:hypothetical protein
MNEQADYLCDVFISHNSADQEWVEKWLLPRLEMAGLHVCVESRDFALGRARLENVELAVANSRNMLLDSDPRLGQAGLLIRSEDLVGRQRCAPPRSIARLTYTDFTEPAAWESQFERLTAVPNSAPN